MIIYTYRCLKCGHEWADKAKQAEPLKELPRKCPHCRTEKWNELSRIVSEPVHKKAACPKNAEVPLS